MATAGATITAAQHPQLRGTKLPNPRFRIAPMSKNLERINGFQDLQTFFPTLGKIYRLSKHHVSHVWLDSKWRMISLDISGTSGPCTLQVVPNIDNSGESVPLPPPLEQPAYLKVTHLLDPIRWMKGRYSLPKHPGLPWHHKTWATAWNKLQDPWNQAYVEAMASYALGRLREEGLSPHFNNFYGAFCAQADIYRYNLTPDFGSMRQSRWFWGGLRKGLYSLKVVNTAKPDADTTNDSIIRAFLREPTPSEFDSEEESEEELTDAEEDESEEDNLETSEDESTEGESVQIQESATSGEGDLESLHSDSLDDIEYADGTMEVAKGNHSVSIDGHGPADDDFPLEDYQVYAEFREYPVMLIAVDKNEGTMDSLLENTGEVGAVPGTQEWELRWSAWLFQVIAALSCAQSMLGFTHNDLHTNNIVWTKTEEEWLYYKNRAGDIFKVPTFGKIFRIIDFGRAIFSINGSQFISDDFKAGNDAAGQYSFPPLHPRPRPEDTVYPNPSFDLCRLAVSLFEALFPEAPAAKKGGKVLSSEEGLETIETESPLYNMLWSWMIDDDGRNVLIDPDMDERYPDFDLYIHIAAKVHVAIPSAQFANPALDRFQVAAADIASDGAGAAKIKYWSLFY